MNKKISAFISALLLLFTAESAFASYCASPAAFRPKVQDCDDNEYVAEAAVLCLDKLEAAVKGATKDLRTAADKLAVTNNQQTSQTDSSGYYGLSQDKLNALLAAGQAARAEVLAYQNEVKWPEDWDNEEITGTSDHDFEEFLASEPCHHDAKTLIDRIVQEIDKHLADLGAVAVATGLKKGTTGDNAKDTSSLRGATSKGAAGQGAGRASNVRVQGQGSLGGSDISGSENLNKPATKPTTPAKK